MQSKPLPSANYLHQCLDYDPLTGDLKWKFRLVTTFVGTPLRSAEHQAANFNARFAGKPALSSPAKNRYLRGSLNGQFYYAQRVIWKMIHGTEPDDVDHENGNRADNRLKNLVSKDRSGNLKNRCLSSNNTSGFHGVSYSRRHQLWAAVIHDQGQKIHLGWFPEKDAAVQARKIAEQQYDYHPNHGRAA